MNLTPEQKQAVSSWVAAGDNLSAVQKKLADQFQVSMTYRDVRFLVDDLNLELKDAAPKVDASDVTKTPLPQSTGAASAAPASGPEKKGFFDKAKERMNDILSRSRVMVLASHSGDLIRSVCDKLLVLDMGQPVYMGDVDEGLEFMMKRSA